MLCIEDFHQTRQLTIGIFMCMIVSWDMAIVRAIKVMAQIILSFPWTMLASGWTIQCLCKLTKNFIQAKRAAGKPITAAEELKVASA